MRSYKIVDGVRHHKNLIVKNKVKYYLATGSLE